MNGTVERIVVALDATSENRVAIGAAARLAARWGVHLHGVFVEDDDLIRLAHLPFARVVTLGAGVEVFDLQQAERQMRVFAERARQELAASAKRQSVEWSFEIARAGGRLTASTGDFLVAGTTTRPVGRHFRVECRWWAIAEAGPSTRLLAHREGDPHGTVAAVLRGREASSERLLAAAIRLAEANEAGLTLIVPPSLAEAPGFKPWLDERLAGHAVETELELLPAPSGLHRRITELHCRLVAVEAGADEAHPDRLRELVATIACDVLVVG
ncbi:MAG TPA: hypothetical protein VG308_17875 [Stellaceae bacterium]|nr:hypothetical protein [Stellaceae bacterium]